ncbi:MAG: hypothetical protein CMM47_00590 [Rhodospirillaceae bacterium]|nr:hypothetical protein [Rhodospirillaceae bacterium]MBM84506.1 hypothetical protein [Rhodospirillaceae bacterium]
MFLRTEKGHVLVPDIHPIFSMPRRQILDIYYDVKFNNELYLVLLAILNDYDLLECHCPITDITDRGITDVKDAIREFIGLIISTGADQLERINLPTIVNNAENPLTDKRLKDTLHGYIKMLESGRYSTITSKLLDAFDDADIDATYDKADDERSLVARFKEYRLRTTRDMANKKLLNGWAMKVLTARSGYSSRQLAKIRHCMDTAATDLREKDLREVIALVKDGLTYEDYERENSLVVVRSLESKLERLLDYEADFGFIDLDDEISANKAAVFEYETKTKVTTTLQAKTPEQQEEAKAKALAFCKAHPDSSMTRLYMRKYKFEL